MRMIVFLISIFLSPYVFGQNTFPTNTKSELIEKLDSIVLINELATSEGEFYAFDVKVLKVKKAYLDKPYFLAEFEDGKTIWIASLLKNEFIQVGRNIRVLGSVSAVQANDSFAKKCHRKKYHILMFAMLDIETNKASTFEAGMKQAETWQDGEIPEKLKNE